MNSKMPRILYNVLLFLLDTFHAWVLSVSASILFHSVMEYPLSDAKIMIISAIVTPAILLFLRSKIFRSVTLLAVGAGALATVTLFILSFFYTDMRAIWQGLIRTIIEWVLKNETPPLLIVLLITMLTGIIVTHGKRLLYLFVLLPPIALIILSLFQANFPVYALVIYTVSSIALVLRRKYDWFETLLSRWPTNTDELNSAASGRTYDNSAVVRSSRGIVPSVKGLGYPNVIIRSLLLILTAAVIGLLFRPVPTPGPMLGEEVSRSIESGFQSMIRSNRFLQNLFGIEVYDPNRRATGTYGKLGGPVEPGSEPILMVKSSSPGVYLRGFTYSEYLGNQWLPEGVSRFAQPVYGTDPSTAIVTDPFEDMIIQYNPSWVLAYTYYSKALAETLWRSRRKYVAVQYLKPYDARFGVFLPSGTRNMGFFDAELKHYYQNDDLHLGVSESKSILYNSSFAPSWIAYEADYLPYTERSILNDKLYEICVPGYYEKFINTLESVNPSSYRNDITRLSMLDEYSKKIYEMYTRVSDKVSKRVIDLAHEITDGLYQSDDLHKAIAIKNYLLSGDFSYTLQPEELPAGVDILDQFLFNERAGYCTYFATAMTVLARAAGVPARYVEGFYVNADSKVGDDLFRLTEQNLHAWCEIYMEGLGFVPIEATAGFGSVTETLSTPEPTAVISPSPTPPASIEPTPSETPDESEPPESTAPAEATAESTPAPTEEPITPAERNMPLAIKILIIVLFAAILIAVILFLLRRLAYRRPGRSGTPQERTISVYRSATALLRKFGYDRGRDETPHEFAQNVAARAEKEGKADNKKDLPPEAVGSFERLTGLYEKAVYGSGDDLAPGCDEALECWDSMIGAFEAKYGKLRTRLLMIGTRIK